MRNADFSSGQAVPCVRNRDKANIVRTCLHKKYMWIFEHNFVAGKYFSRRMQQNLPKRHLYTLVKTGSKTHTAYDTTSQIKRQQKTSARFSWAEVFLVEMCSKRTHGVGLVCSRQVIYQMYQELQQYHAVICAALAVVVAVSVQCCLLVQCYRASHSFVQQNCIRQIHIAVQVDIAVEDTRIDGNSRAYGGGGCGSSSLSGSGGRLDRGFCLRKCSRCRCGGCILCGRGYLAGSSRCCGSLGCCGCRRILGGFCGDRLRAFRTGDLADNDTASNGGHIDSAKGVHVANQIVTVTGAAVQVVLVDEDPALTAVGGAVDALRIGVRRLAVHIQGVGVAVLCAAP